MRETFILENAEKPLLDRPFLHDPEAEWEWGDYLIPHYRATEPEPHIVNPRYDDGDDRTRWSPCIFMPRWASRITLEVTGLRVERVQDITEKDAIAEGIQSDDDYRDSSPADFPCPRCEGHAVHEAFGADYGITEVDCDMCDTAQKRFGILWDSINAKRGYSWESNPHVWVVEFKRIEKNCNNRRW